MMINMKAKKVNEMIDPYTSEEEAGIDIDVSYKRQMTINGLKAWFLKWDPDAEYTIEDNLDVLVSSVLYLSGSECSLIPENIISVNGLNIANTKITKLPDKLKLIKYSFNAANTKLEYLDPDLKIGGSVNLRDTLVTSIPNHLRLTGLNLKNTPIDKLPDDLKVRWSLNIIDTNIKEIPPGVKYGTLKR